MTFWVLVQISALSLSYSRFVCANAAKLGSCYKHPVRTRMSVCAYAMIKM